MSVTGVLVENWRLTYSAARESGASGALLHHAGLFWLSCSIGAGMLILFGAALARARGWRLAGLLVNVGLNHLAVGILYWVFAVLKIQGALAESGGFALALVVTEVIMLNALVGVHYYRRQSGPDPAVLEEWMAGMGLAKGPGRPRLWMKWTCFTWIVVPALIHLAIRRSTESGDREGDGRRVSRVAEEAGVDVA